MVTHVYNLNVQEMLYQIKHNCFIHIILWPMILALFAISRHSDVHHHAASVSASDRLNHNQICFWIKIHTIHPSYFFWKTFSFIACDVNSKLHLDVVQSGTKRTFFGLKYVAEMWWMRVKKKNCRIQVTWYLTEAFRTDLFKGRKRKYILQANNNVRVVLRTDWLKCAQKKKKKWPVIGRRSPARSHWWVRFSPEAHDALHHFSCKMLTPRQCSGACTFKPPLLPP